MQAPEFSLGGIPSPAVTPLAPPANAAEVMAEIQSQMDALTKAELAKVQENVNAMLAQAAQSMAPPFRP